MKPDTADTSPGDKPTLSVRDLIERLQLLPPDMPVLVEGYETGWDTIHELRELDVVRNMHAEDWDGEYAEPQWLEHAQPEALPSHVVVIVGKRGRRR